MVSIMMSDSEIIAVVQAHKEGKKIEFTTDGDNWYLCENPMWNFTKSHYRVYTEPRKPREWCLEIAKDGSVYNASRLHSADEPITGEKMVRVREVIE